MENEAVSGKLISFHITMMRRLGALSLSLSQKKVQVVPYSLCRCVALGVSCSFLLYVSTLVDDHR